MCMAVSKKDLQCTIGKNIRDARKICGYTKEVLAEKERMEHGIPVNDNTMVELGNLCSYLKLDFQKYFPGYKLPSDLSLIHI